MTWELYEVWAEDEFGHEKLIETTKSRKQAIDIARDAVKNGYILSKVWREVDEEDMDLVQTFKAG